MVADLVIGMDSVGIKNLTLRAYALESDFLADVWTKKGGRFNDEVKDNRILQKLHSYACWFFTGEKVLGIEKRYMLFTRGIRT